MVIFFDEFLSVLVTLFESIGCFFLTLIKLFIPAVYGGDNFVCVNNIIIAFYKTVVKSLDVYYKKKILEVDKKRDFCPPVVEKITLLLHMQSKTIHKQ